MRDIVFVVVVLAFFTVAVLFVRACELVLGGREGVNREHQP